MTIGQRIREARLGRQMTQQELVGDYITRNMLSKIENDAATPSVRTLEYLAGAMDLPPGAFLSDTPPQNAAQPQEERLAVLKRLLDQRDPRFATQLAEAKKEWSETGLRLIALEAEFMSQMSKKDLQSD
jgi:transcriptional regulator with XRE-family HTH domain